MLASHRKFDYQFLRIRANKDERRSRFSIGKTFTILFLTKYITDINTAKQTTCGQVVRKLELIA
jgi:hypothetical protein